MVYARGNLFWFFARDHDRIEDLLEKAMRSGRPVDAWFYGVFREELVLHITMEEQILLPTAERMAAGQKLDFVRQMRLEHEALLALLVPEPLPMVLNALKTILAKHTALEEQSGGMYEVCEQLTQQEVDQLLRLLMETPGVRANPLQEPSQVLDATRRALERAGYFLDEFTSPSTPETS